MAPQEVAHHPKTPLKSCLRNGKKLNEEQNAVSTPQVLQMPQTPMPTQTPPEWAARQIAAAYEEHAAIIQSLRNELELTKSREKALITEFTERFKSMHTASKRTTSTNAMSRAKNNSSSVPFDEDEMPMDEMADTALVEEQYDKEVHAEQQIQMEKFIEQKEKEMAELRTQNQKRIEEIEYALQEKVVEIKKLRDESHRVEMERDYLFQLQQQQQIQQQQQLKRKKLLKGKETSSNISETRSRPETDATHPEDLPQVVTPTREQSTSKSSPPKFIGRRTSDINENAVSPDLDSSIDSTVVSTLGFDGSNYATSSEEDNSISPRKDLRWKKSRNHLFQDNTSANIRHEMNDAKGSEHVLKKMSNAIDALVLRQRSTKGATEESFGLTEEEKKFVNQMRLAVHSSQRKQRTAIATLQKALQETTIELQDGASKISKLSKDMIIRQDRVTQLEQELQINKFSKEKIIDLEKELQMVTKNKEIISKEKSTLEDKLHETQEELEKLRKEKSTSQEESEVSLQAIQRVMADVNASKEEEVAQLNARIERLTHENTEIRKAIDPTFDSSTLQPPLSPTSVVIEEEEFRELRDKADKFVGLDLELGKLMMECEETKAQKDEIENELEKLKKDMSDVVREFDEMKTDFNKVSSELSSKTDAVERLEEEKSTLVKKSDDVRNALKEQLHAVEKEKDSINANEIELRATLKAVIEERDSALKRIELLKSGKDYNDDGTNELMDKFEKEVNELKIKIEDRDKLITVLTKDNQSLKGSTDQLRSELGSHEEIITKFKNETKASKSNLKQANAKIKSLLEEVEILSSQVSKSNEVLQTAKGVHAREQRLEDELSEIRSLLDKAMKSKALLKRELQMKTDALSTAHKMSNESLQKYSQENIILEKKLKETFVEAKELRQQKIQLERELEKTKEGIALVTTPDSIETFVLDNGVRSKDNSLKTIEGQLREQQILHSQLRTLLDDKEDFGAKKIIDELSKAVNFSLCTIGPESTHSNNPSPVRTSANKTDSQKSAELRLKILEESLKAQKEQNKNLRAEIDEVIKKRDEETSFCNAEISRLKIQCSQKVNYLAEKDEELRILRESLKEASVGYISEDDSDTESVEGLTSNAISTIALSSGSKNNAVATGVGDDDTKEKIAVLVKAREKAEKEAKLNAESLANAKMVIVSLEQSNKNMTQDLRSRLQDSNEAIVALLDQASKHEKEASKLKNEIAKLQKSKEEANEYKCYKEKYEKILNSS